MIKEVITLMQQNKGCFIKHFHRENKAELFISNQPPLVIAPKYLQEILACCFEDSLYNFDYERYYLRHDAMEILSHLINQ